MTMHRAASLTNNDSEVNEGMAELELQKLQRQYRIMEGDRKAYSEESRLLIAKQRGNIEKLKRENQYLVDELGLLEQRTDDRRKSSAHSKKAEALTEQADLYTRKIRAILADIAELDNAIALRDCDIDQQRADLGGVNAAYENSEAIGKQIKVLENRLDKALVKFNKSLAVNKRMRAVIDNLRRERMVFDNIYRKFERELAEQKKQMADIIEASNSAYEARDEAQARMIALREKADKEHQAYIQEIKELDRSLEQDRRLKEFMATKVADRQPAEETFSHAFASDDKDGHKKEKTAQKTATKARFGSQEALNDSLEAYNAAFDDIRRETGVSSIKDLVQRMKTVEDENFSLFNYVNEINNDIEQLSEEIVEIQKKMDALKVQNVSEEEKMAAELKALEAQLNTNTEKHDTYEKQYAETIYMISDLRNGVERLVTRFDTVLVPPPVAAPRAETAAASSANPPTSASDGKDGYEEEGFVEDTAKGDTGERDTTAAPVPTALADPVPPLPTELSAPTTVTDSSLLYFLGLVEQKTNELLTLHYLVNTPKKSGSAADRGVSAGPDGNNGGENAGGREGSASVSHSGGIGQGLASAGGAPVGSAREGGRDTSNTLGPVLGGLLGHGPTAPIGNITIIAPSTGDDHDDDLISEDDDRPLTREELEKRTLRGLARREKQLGTTKEGAKHKRKGASKRSAVAAE
ncbi:Coiled-coil domain-containing protein 63 [Thoreauomyces humboldtii]|nr:Coiled-coil domain-containing protein 63 [Thoreauomyces humboldtii]